MGGSDPSVLVRASNFNVKFQSLGISSNSVDGLYGDGIEESIHHRADMHFRGGALFGETNERWIGQRVPFAGGSDPGKSYSRLEV